MLNLTLSNYAQCCPFREVPTADLWNLNFTETLALNCRINSALTCNNSPSIYLLLGHDIQQCRTKSNATILMILIKYMEPSTFTLARTFELNQIYKTAPFHGSCHSQWVLWVWTANHPHQVLLKSTHTVSVETFSLIETTP
jgi:hypothetical protein